MTPLASSLSPGKTPVMRDLPKLPKPDAVRQPPASPALVPAPRPNLPKPDALVRPQTPPPLPLVDPLYDPLHPVEPTSTAAPSGLDEKAESPDSGLSSIDASHAFASVLFSGFGRAFVIILVSMFAFGLTEACYRISLLDDGWRWAGFRGLGSALLDIPGVAIAAPPRWLAAVGDCFNEPVGVPYLLLLLGGFILAIRSELHIVKLAFFYALVAAFYSAAYHHMTNPVSYLAWFALLLGMFRLRRWYWRRQNALEDEPDPVEETPGDR